MSQLRDFRAEKDQFLATHPQGLLTKDRNKLSRVRTGIKKTCDDQIAGHLLELIPFRGRCNQEHASCFERHQRSKPDRT